MRHKTASVAFHPPPEVSRHLCRMPPGRELPFVLVRDAEVLVTPFPYRDDMTPEQTRATTEAEAALRQAAADRRLPAGDVWVYPATGTITTAPVTADWLRRRQFDNVCTRLRLA